jgi:hypothetical protein
MSTDKSWLGASEGESRSEWHQLKICKKFQLLFSTPIFEWLGIEQTKANH